MAEMTNAELSALRKRVTTWDQAELDGLLGRAAIDYAVSHEKDVRQLARQMNLAFPFGMRWWKIGSALRNVFSKNAAIKKRAADIRRDRDRGLIAVRNGRLEYIA